MNTSRKVKSALHEVTTKTEAAVDRATSQTWENRAIACYEEYARTGLMKWLLRGEQARHEALEHAAGAEDHGKMVGQVQRRIDAKRPKIARAGRSKFSTKK